MRFIGHISKICDPIHGQIDALYINKYGRTMLGEPKKRVHQKGWGGASGSGHPSVYII